MIDIPSLKNRIDQDAVIAIMDALDVPLARADGDTLLYYSSCHHRDDPMAHKPKLYAYGTTLHCYACGLHTDIIGFVQHMRDCSFNAAIAYVCSILHINTDDCVQKDDVDRWQELRRWLPNTDDDIPEQLLTYDKSVLAAFDPLYPTEWLEYGITRDSMDKFGIGWYGRLAAISIPVMFNGELVGIRGRFTRKQDIDKGKYRPLTMLDGTTYKFPSSQLFYGYDQNKAAIQRSKRVLLFESEKSVLKAPSYGIDNSLAVFGSNISKRQIELLLDLGVNDVVLCMDSDYRQVGDDDFKFFAAKMKRLAGKLRPYFTMSIVWNNQGYDAYKCNIMDLPYEQAVKLYESRTVV